MPIFDPTAYRLEIGGLVRKPRSFTYDELLALPQAHQVSTFHCVTGWTVHDVRWSGVRFEHLLDLVEPLPEAKALRFDSLEVPYNDSLTLEQVEPARRDARARDGRAAALAPARLAGARRDPRDVRLQGRQVADEDRARRPAADRLLGRARLRPGRLGRPLEWLRRLTARARLAALERTERAVHWIHAAAFCVLLGSGLCLYLPSLAEAVGRRPLLKTIHIYTALAWAIALVLVVVVGDRRALRRTLREVDYFDADDVAWLRGRRAPQGRLNAGQKLNTIVTAAFAILFAISGFFLWYGERDTRFRLANALLVHDYLMYVSLLLFLGHLWFVADLPADAARAERDHARLGARGLGAAAPREVGRVGRGS